MRKIILLVTLFTLFVLAYISKPASDTSSETMMPPPVEDIIVKMDGEDRPKSKAKKAWFDLMHKTIDGSDWKEIEYQNALKSAALKNELRNELQAKGPQSIDILAGGLVAGKWIERGSDNNAGNMITVNYFPEEDLFFGRSDGGTLWKGDRSGYEWEVVNQDFRFDGDLVEMRYLPNGNIRYIASLNKRPVYSDDDGVTWTPSEGLQHSNSSKIQDFVEDSQGRMYILYKANNINFVSAYMSNDNGSSWQEIYEFTDRNEKNYNLVTVGNTDDIMVIEQLNTDLTRLHLWNESDQTFDIVREESNVGFGSGNDRANLNAVYYEDTLRLHVLSPIYVDVNGEQQKRQQLFVSKDTARTWELISQTPSNPWNVGLFVSPSNPNNMMYGEVNPYRSSNGGKFWNKVSDWWEYYGDIFGKLHADIMDIKEFKDIDGNPFTIVCNHGGLSESEDYGKTFSNRGLISLNIGQYYSVATHPTNRQWVFAGSQDQGFQRGKIIGDDPMSMDQVISGDYGHIVFSGPEDKMWTVYPWGSVTYYDNPILQGPTTGWELQSENESVWIPPLLGHPDKTQNAIFMAGGNIDGGAGSHMIRLDIDENGEVVPSQFDFNFLSSGGGAVSAMGISPINYDLIFVANTVGHIFKSADGGVSFERKQVGLPGDHYLYGSCIKPSQIDENVVYVSGNGYGNSVPGVFKSTDAGETYQRMDNGLPNTMVFCLAPNEDESLIYAATEAGPFVYIAAIDEWRELSSAETPNQTYWSVEYIPETQTARFGTYGRGIWDFNFESLSTSIEDEEFASQVNFKVYPNPVTDLLTLDSQFEDKADIVITNQQGQVVSRMQNKFVKNLQIDVSNYTTGIYFVTITSENRSVTEKLIKK